MIYAWTLSVKMKICWIVEMKKVILWYCGKCDRFVEAGGNFIDTADCYSRGAAEEVSSSSSSQWCWQILLPKKFKSSPHHHMEAEGLSSNLFSSHKHWKGVPPYSSPTKLDFDYDWVKENTSTWHFGLDLIVALCQYMIDHLHVPAGWVLVEKAREEQHSFGHQAWNLQQTRRSQQSRPLQVTAALKNPSFDSLKLKSTSSQSKSKSKLKSKLKLKPTSSQSKSKFMFLARQNILRSVEESLNRLQTSCERNPIRLNLWEKSY